MPTDLPTCTVYIGTSAWHDGEGYYYIDDEYPDEGSCGAFSTFKGAADHATESEYARPCEADVRPASDWKLPNPETP